MSRISVHWEFTNMKTGMTLEHTNLEQLLLELSDIRDFILPHNIRALLLLNPVLDIELEESDGEKIPVRFVEKRVS